MPGALEYEEEDLFEEETANPINTETSWQFNAAAPIAGPSRPRIPSPILPPPPLPPGGRLPVLKPSVGLERTRPRLVELRERKFVRPGAVTVVGPVSLKEQCMAVVKANAIRTWDIGDMEYSLVKEFLDTLPAEQLAAIEEASPHIRKDTDWLWEYFLLTDYALAHEKYAMRHGEIRTSGWRRAYKKAAEDARERQQNAAERVAERYKELDKIRADKRIVVLNQVIQPKAQKKVQGGMFGSQKPLQVTSKPTGILGKARADAQRARMAMTHASGKFIPPPNRPPPISSTSISLAPNARGYPAPKAIAGPRIPGPRSTSTSSRIPPSSSSSHPLTDIIPGAYPTAEYIARRSELPAHLVNLPSPAPQSVPQRFSTDPKRKFSTKVSADVPNFKPPERSSPGARADFFGISPISTGLSGAKRPRSERGDMGSTGSPVKMARMADGGGNRSSPTSATGSDTGSSRSVSVSGSAGGLYSSGRISADEASKLKGVLFRSKPRSRTVGR